MFRIGQRVVWVGAGEKTVSDVVSIRPAICLCEGVDLLTNDPTIETVIPLESLWQCPDCGAIGKSSQYMRWRHQDCFRPLDEDYAEGVLSEIKKSTLDETLELLEQIKTKETVK